MKSQDLNLPHTKANQDGERLSDRDQLATLQVRPVARASHSGQLQKTSQEMISTESCVLAEMTRQARKGIKYIRVRCALSLLFDNLLRCSKSNVCMTCRILRYPGDGIWLDVSFFQRDNLRIGCTLGMHGKQSRQDISSELSSQAILLASAALRRIYRNA